MNARVVVSGRISLALLWMLSGFSSAAPTDYLEDPLRARPPLLDSGAVLPGDQQPFACPPPAFDRQALTLADAVDIALCANPQIKSAWAYIKVQAEALGEAKSAYLPTVTLGLSRIDDRTSYPGLSAPAVAMHGNADNVGLDWRLFDFGGREANRRMSTAMLDAAIATHDAVLQKTLESVIGAYFDAQTAKATWDAKRMNEDLARNTFEAAQRREARGAGAQTETLQAATALAKATLERGRSRGDYLKALSILTYAVGLPPETALSLAPDLTDDTVALERDLTQWLDDAQQRHPAIVAARAQVEAAREKVTTTRSDGLPSIDFTFNNYQNGRPSEGFPTIRTNEKVVGLTLTIPVFEGFARTYKVSGARAQVEQKQADLEDTAHQVLMDVVKAHADAQSALGNLDASHALLDVAQSAMDTVQRKFDRGATDILEILNTQAALSDANLERIRCLSEWRSARLRLLAASGALGRWEVLR